MWVSGSFSLPVFLSSRQRKLARPFISFTELFLKMVIVSRYIKTCEYAH